MPREQVIVFGALVIFGAGYVVIGVISLYLQTQLATAFIAGWVALTYVFLGRTKQLVALAEALSELR